MANKRRKNKLALPIGIITIILAVIGLIAVIHSATGLAQNAKNKTAQKEEYESLLKPVVMFDPDPFDDLTKANKSQLLYSAIWALLMDEDGMSKYPYATGENFGIQIPQADVEESFTRLYGTEIEVAQLHSGTDMSSYDIVYDSALQSYIIPITGIESAYNPKVYSIDKQGSSVVLNVGYIGTKAWADMKDGEYTSPEPDKYMKITLRERSGGMYVSSIQAADGQEIAERVSTTTIPYEVEEETQAEEEITDMTDEIITEEPETEEPLTDENGETVTEAETQETSEGENTAEESAVAEENA